MHEVGIVPKIFVSVIEVHGLLGVSLSSEQAKYAQAQLDEKKARAGAREPTAPLAKPLSTPSTASGAGTAPQLTRHESHRGLQRDLLVHEWAEAEGAAREKVMTIRAQLGALASSLSALPKGAAHAGFVQERTTLSAELDEVDAALNRLQKALPVAEGADANGTSGGADPKAPDAALDDASIKRAWETYCNNYLKLRRVAARTAELEQAVATSGDAKRAAPAAAAAHKRAK